MLYFYRAIHKTTGKYWLRCVNWYPSVARSRAHLANINLTDVSHKWRAREEVPLACVKKLFPGVKWIPGQEREWPQPENNPASQ